MDVFFGILAALFLLAVGVVTVFLVLALIQVRETARSVKLLTDNVNQEVVRVHNITNAAANVAAAVGGTLGKSASLGVRVLARFLRRKNDKTWSSPHQEGNGRR
jgi:hypothetical protein